MRSRCDATRDGGKPIGSGTPTCAPAPATPSTSTRRCTRRRCGASPMKRADGSIRRTTSRGCRKMSATRARRHVGRGARALEHADHPGHARGARLRRVGLPPRGGVGVDAARRFSDRRRPRGRSRTRRAVPQVGRRRWPRRPAARRPAEQARLSRRSARGKASARQRPARPRGDRQDVRWLRQAATPEDVVYVVLIGHGSYDGKTAKFNLPGPDMAAADFNAQFSKLPTKQIVFVDTTSASGPFINELSGAGPHDHHRDAQRRGELLDALRRLLRRRADGRRGRRGQEPARDVLEAFQFAKARCSAPTSRKGCCRPSTRCSTTTATRRAAPTRRPTGADGKVGGAARDRLGRRRGAAAGRPETARARPRAARPRAPRRIAAAAQGKHGPGEIPE